MFDHGDRTLSVDQPYVNGFDGHVFNASLVPLGGHGDDHSEDKNGICFLWVIVTKVLQP